MSARAHTDDQRPDGFVQKTNNKQQQQHRRQRRWRPFGWRESRVCCSTFIFKFENNIYVSTRSHRGSRARLRQPKVEHVCVPASVSRKCVNNNERDARARPRIGKFTRIPITPTRVRSPFDARPTDDVDEHDRPER